MRCFWCFHVFYTRIYMYCEMTVNLFDCSDVNIMITMYHTRVTVRAYKRCTVDLPVLLS